MALSDTKRRRLTLAQYETAEALFEAMERERLERDNPAERVVPDTIENTRARLAGPARLASPFEQL